MSTDIKYVKHDRVGIISINRPERRNAVNRDIILQLYNLLAPISIDPNLSVLILRGEGNDFCVGADVANIEKGSVSDHDHRYFQIPVLLHNMRAVTIAAIRGGCAGAGLSWATACDFRIADVSARFNTAALRLGLAGDMGAPWFLTRIIGAGRARDLCFFPRKLDASEAESIGLVSKVTTSADFEQVLQAMIDELAGFAPLALAGLKANFVEAERTDLQSFIAIESLRQRQLFASEDRVEGVQAFLEKRKPVFRGR